MKIKYIKFKVTTSKLLKCDNCKNKLKGEDGFVHIVGKVGRGFFGGFENIRICWDCFLNLLNEFEEGRKNRVENYKLLIKKAILRGLK